MPMLVRPRKTNQAYPSHEARLLQALPHQRFCRELRQGPWAYWMDLQNPESNEPAPLNLLFAGASPAQAPPTPEEAFAHLRWGGRIVILASDHHEASTLSEAFTREQGFHVERIPTDFSLNTMGLRIPGITPRGTYFVARKTYHSPPLHPTSRYTYDVHLHPCTTRPGQYVVRKRLPDCSQLYVRLKAQFPDLSEEDLRYRAAYLHHQILPAFLTREARILEQLQQRLPEHLRDRVPQIDSLDYDAQQRVSRIDMPWITPAAHPLDQLEFAEQAAELLDALHHHAGVIHQDLRLDNIVVGEQGVAFVDFGCAAGINEKLSASSHKLIAEFLKTSRVQRTLQRLAHTGQITNEALTNVLGQSDPHVDTFYLALQIARPDHSPDLRHLVLVDPEDPLTTSLNRLTAAFLRPKNPKLSHCKTAGDLLRGVRSLRQQYAAA